MDSFKTYFCAFLQTQNIDYKIYESSFLVFELPVFCFKIYFMNAFENGQFIQYFHENNNDKKLKEIYVWADQWHSARPIVISRLNSLLGLNFKLPARVFSIKRIDRIVSDDFLNTNHLQFAVNSKIKYGLYLPKRYFRLLGKTQEFDEKKHEILFAVMTFSSPKKFFEENKVILSYELIRFATKNGFNIIGGFSKMLRFFIDEKIPGNIMTYIDADWSDGEGFKKMGFKFIEKTKPMYFKLDDNTKRILVNNEQDANVINTGSLKFIYNNIEQI